MQLGNIIHFIYTRPTENVFLQLTVWTLFFFLLHKLILLPFYHLNNHQLRLIIFSNGLIFLGSRQILFVPNSHDPFATTQKIPQSLINSSLQP